MRQLFLNEFRMNARCRHQPNPGGRTGLVSLNDCVRAASVALLNAGLEPHRTKDAWNTPLFGFYLLGGTFTGVAGLKCKDGGFPGTRHRQLLPLLPAIAFARSSEQTQIESKGTIE